MKKGFTLIELLVVIGMIAILTAAASSSVMKARKRSQLARAETEVREMTNAILAYENYDKDRSLDKRLTGGNWVDATKNELGFILGEEQDEEGNKLPVLFNAAVTGSDIRDPWGTTYQFMIAKTSEAVDDGGDNVGADLNTFMYLPNLYWHRAE